MYTISCRFNHTQGREKRTEGKDLRLICFSVERWVREEEKDKGEMKKGRRGGQRVSVTQGPKTGSQLALGRPMHLRCTVSRDYFSLVQFLMARINIAR